MKHVILFIALFTMAIPLFAVDSFTLVDGNKVVGAYKGASAKHIYVMTPYNCLVSIPKVSIRKAMVDGKDVSSQVQLAQSLLSMDAQAYFPVIPEADVYGDEIYAPSSRVSSTSGRSFDAIVPIAVPLWILAISTVYVSFIEKD